MASPSADRQIHDQIIRVIESRIPVSISHLRLEYPQLLNTIDRHLDIGIAPPIHPFPSVKMPTCFTRGLRKLVRVIIRAVDHASDRIQVETTMEKLIHPSIIIDRLGYVDFPSTWLATQIGPEGLSHSPHSRPVSRSAIWKLDAGLNQQARPFAGLEGPSCLNLAGGPTVSHFPGN
jgi:hypothetical protein